MTFPTPPPRPGRRVVRVLLAVVAAAVILVLLFTVVFPWVEQRLENPTLGAAPAASSTATAGGTLSGF